MGNISINRENIHRDSCTEIINTSLKINFNSYEKNTNLAGITK